MIRFAKRLVPFVNQLLLNLKALFMGDPSATMKVIFFFFFFNNKFPNSIIYNNYIKKKIAFKNLWPDLIFNNLEKNKMNIKT